MIIILVLHAAFSSSRCHHLNRTMTIHSGLEVQQQHGDLGGPYGSPGPTPGSITALGQLHRSEFERGFCPQVGLKTATTSRAGREESPLSREAPRSPVSHLFLKILSPRAGA